MLQCSVQPASLKEREKSSIMRDGKGSTVEERVGGSWIHNGSNFGLFPGTL